MKLQRFIGNFNLGVSELRLEDKEVINQLKNVFRLKVGSEIILGDGQGSEALSEITNINRDFILVKIKKVSTNSNEPANLVILYCSILKKENFELAVQKAVEVGVSAIVPIITTRTVKTGLSVERLEKIIKEASEQSGRGILPKLYPSADFDSALLSAQKENNLNILFDASGEDLKSDKKKVSKQKIGIFIGPEGGWEVGEIEKAQKAGFDIASLGSLTLRAETAVITASYLAVNN
jgi:16S rRNA (uracil1498-N3)-methyltransferase